MAIYRSSTGPGVYNSVTIGLIILAVIAAVGVVPRLAGLRSFDDEAISLQIEREDSALCEKFGFAAGSTQFTNCMAELAALRKRHEDLIIAHSWP